MKLGEHLATCRELSRSRPQNGRIDSAAVRIDVLERDGASPGAAVDVDAVLEGSGCVADRAPCFAGRAGRRAPDGPAVSECSAVADTGGMTP